jgi:hypothetical protein
VAEVVRYQAPCGLEKLFEVLEQCVSLPGEISQILLHCLRQQFISRGCQALKQLQLLVRLSVRAKSVLELLLLRLDKKGLDISSLWMINGDYSIVSVLWPKLYAAWLSEERWSVQDSVAESLMKMCGPNGSKLCFAWQHAPA